MWDDFGEDNDGGDQWDRHKEWAGCGDWGITDIGALDWNTMFCWRVAINYHT